MMKINNSFSFRRLWMLMRWDFGTNWKVYAWRYLGLYIGFLSIMFLAIILLPTPTNSSMALDISGLWLAFSTVLFLVLLFRSASLVMERKISKDGRVKFLMLPVSNAEKFVWRVFFSTVFFILMAIVAYALADATFYLLSLLWNQKLGIYQNWTIGEFLKMTKLAVFPSPYKGPGGGPFIGPWWALGWTSSTGGYFLHSLFILGGCVWHRLAGLKVLGILFVVAWGVPMMLNIFVPGRAPGLPFDGWFALCAVLAILCWFLAYRFFCRSQIV
ncbi:MAG: hypothetical protein IKK62_00615 [Bacteroidaceae bacterium]|nr:hypothetical protein [Bacteroidaceae bacterium]